MNTFPPLVRALAGAVLLLTLAAPGVAQQPAFITLGTACTAPNEPTPAIGAVGLPRIGTTFEVTYTGPNQVARVGQIGVRPFLLTGFGFANPPFAIPLGLFPAQPAGCHVMVLPDLSTEMPEVRGGLVYEASVALPIPNQAALVGATWFHQWIAIGRQCGIVGCNVIWVITSEAAQVVVGI